MDAIDCIKTRRSFRSFQDKPVPRELVMEVLDCARHAPSSMNSQPCQFIVITDRKQKEALAALKKIHPSPWLVDAPVVIGVCVDINKSRTRWIEDGAVAAENILLAANALGLGACWVAMRYEDTSINARIQQALGAGSNMYPLCVVAMGYPAGEPEPHELRDLHSMVR